MTKFILQYSHNIIEHLGLKLYQNRPTRVIAELLSNSWDADAENVWVNMDMGEGDRWVAVGDNGTGMNADILHKGYLVVGTPKRSKPEEVSAGGRRLMGRKGIGKLAAFGIARCVDLITSAGGETFWLRFKLDDLLDAKDGKGEYEPILVYEGNSFDELPTGKDTTGAVAEWIGLITDQGKRDGRGTLVLMTELSLKKALNVNQLTSSIGKRFTVSIRDDFVIRVNEEKVTAENGLPRLDFRIPESGQTLEMVGEHEIRWWVGFVERADWPQDQAGVGVYAHGKIAQDLPFTFGVKGKEVFSRYMFGVVEADFLDELPTDLISTDRTNIDWTADEAEALYNWGNEKVRGWLREFETWRSQLERKENRDRIKKVAESGGPTVSEEEQEQIVELLSEITPSLGKDSKAKEDATRAISEAWLQRPMRKLVKDLWDEIGRDGDVPADVFTRTIERLSKSTVPESLNLAVVFAQRVFALARLHEYVHHGIEPDLQKLIEKFPWIIEPDIAVLTADRALKTAVRRAEDEGQIPTGRRTIVGGVSEENRPDFVFLSSPEKKIIVVVELKSPQEDLTIDNRQQLSDYLTWFEAHYPDAELKGLLVGRNGSHIEEKHVDITIIPWTEVLEKSRARNLELLSAMLVTTAHYAEGDTRVKQALELGGDDAQNLLQKLAADHQEVQDLLDSVE